MGNSPNVQLDFSKAVPLGQNVNAVPSSNGAASSLDFSKAQSISEGVDNTPKQDEGFFDRVTKGFSAGAAETLMGAANIGKHIPGVQTAAEKVGDALGLPKLAPGIDPYATVQNKVNENLINPVKDKGLLSPEGLGYGTETLSEFLLGDKALSEGLTWAQKLESVAKVAKIIEKSPKLMSAIKIGADAMKAGVVQGVQTGVRDNDVKQAVKEGGTMAGVSLLLGVPMEVLRSAISKASAGGEKLGKLAEEAKNSPTDEDLINTLKSDVGEANAARVAEHEGGEAGAAQKILDKQAAAAPEKKEVVNSIADNINNAETNMHENFEVGLEGGTDTAGNVVEGIKPRLKGETTPAATSPIASKAQELLDNPPVSTTAEHPAVTSARKLDKDLLNPEVSTYLADLAAGAGNRVYDKATGKLVSSVPYPDYDIDSLINLRQTVRSKMSKFAAKYGYGDINVRTLKEVLPAIDDTIQEMADKAGDSSVGKDYEALRSTYKNTIKYFNDPEYEIIQKLQAGDINSAANDFIKGNKTLDNAQKLESFFKQTMKSADAEKAMDDFRSAVLKNMTKDAANESTGVVDAEKLINNINKIDPETRTKFFDTARNAEFAETLANAKTVGGAKESLETAEKGRMKILGNMDAPKNFLTGAPAKVIERVNTLRDLIGPDKMAEFGNNVFNTLLRDSMTERGVFDAAKFLDNWQKINPEIRNNLFKVDKTLQNARIDELLKDAKTAANAQHLARAGVLAIGGAAGGGLSHMGAGIGTLLGLLAGEGVGGITKGRQLLDYIANRPATWKMFRIADKAVNSPVTKPIEKAAGTAAKIGAIRTIYGNTKSALGGEKKAGAVNFSKLRGNTMVEQNPPGLITKGNIDLKNRPIIYNNDGSISTEYSTSFSDSTGHEILVPTIVNGKFLTPDGKKPPEGSKAEKEMFKRAEEYYYKTGQHLGIFDNVQHEEEYANKLHSRDLKKWSSQK